MSFYVNIAEGFMKRYWMSMSIARLHLDAMMLSVLVLVDAGGPISGSGPERHVFDITGDDKARKASATSILCRWTAHCHRRQVVRLRKLPRRDSPPCPCRTNLYTAFTKA